MPNYSLDLSEFQDTEFHLIGVKTSIEDYHLAFLLNKYLETYFTRSENNLEFEIKNEKQSFSLFNFDDEHNYKEWNLISNKFIQSNINNQTNNLFSVTNYDFSTINYLIPEQKRFDYFIKITGGDDVSLCQKLIIKLKTIHQIDAVFEINPLELKSKDFLIF